MNREVIDLYLDDIIPNRFQPREVFNEEALKELSASIKEHGVIQPIIVRKIGDKYEIIAGERRYKASAMAGMTKIPAIIRNLDDKEASKVALLENLQRKDLTAIEEARTYQKILELDSMTQEQLGRSMGKSQASIANKMRLLSLPDEVQEALLQDQISERHARSLLNLNTSEQQINMLRKIIANRMTVRELDSEIKNMQEDTASSIIPTDSITVVEEVGPKVEVTSSKDELITSSKAENLNKNVEDLFDYDFTNLTLDEDEDDSEELVKIEKKSSVEEEPDFRKIDVLSNQTDIYNHQVKDAVNEIKILTEKLQNQGFSLKVEEMDFENTYQIIVKIEKDK